MAPRGMAGLNHDFIVLPSTGERSSQWHAHWARPGTVSLHDDLLRYFADTLEWIPSENPANASWPGRGINWYGPTAFSGHGARFAQSIFNAWADILSLGPPRYELTGSFGWVEAQEKDGRYEKLVVDRDDVVARLRTLATMAEKASHPGHWLMHHGI